MSQRWDIKQVDKEAPKLLEKLRALSKRLSSYFVGKEEIVDLLILCTLAQEPLHHRSRGIHRAALPREQVHAVYQGTHGFPRCSVPRWIVS